MLSTVRQSVIGQCFARNWLQWDDSSRHTRLAFKRIVAIQVSIEKLNSTCIDRYLEKSSQLMTSEMMMMMMNSRLVQMEP